MHAQRHQERFWAILQSKSALLDKADRLEILTLIKKVWPDEVYQWGADRSILRIRTDIVRVLDPVEAINTRVEDQKFNYYKTGFHLWFVEWAEVQKVDELRSHIAELLSSFFWTKSDSKNGIWVYVATRNPNRKDWKAGEFYYAEPVYFDLPRQSVE